MDQCYLLFATTTVCLSLPLLLLKREGGGEKERERKESGLDGSNEEKKVKNLKESRVRRREDRESGEVQSQTLLN